MTTTGIEAVDLAYRRGNKVILQSITFALRPGTITALVGENGAGKSSLLAILATLQRPCCGHVALAGIDAIRRPRQAREKIGVVFQSAALEQSLSVEENLAAMARLQGMRSTQISRRVDELLHELGIAAQRKQKIKTLSGGASRKVELARALIHDPPVLLLDEPTIGLDPIARENFWSLLSRLARQGRTILLATHHTEEAMRADQVMLLHQGRMMRLAPWTALVHTLGLPGGAASNHSAQPEDQGAAAAADHFFDLLAAPQAMPGVSLHAVLEAAIPATERSAQGESP